MDNRVRFESAEEFFVNLKGSGVSLPQVKAIVKGFSGLLEAGEGKKGGEDYTEQEKLFLGATVSRNGENYMAVFPGGKGTLKWSLTEKAVKMAEKLPELAVCPIFIATRFLRKGKEGFEQQVKENPSKNISILFKGGTDGIRSFLKVKENRTDFRRSSYSEAVLKVSEAVKGTPILKS